MMFVCSRHLKLFPVLLRLNGAPVNAFECWYEVIGILFDCRLGSDRK